MYVHPARNCAHDGQHVYDFAEDGRTYCYDHKARVRFKVVVRDTVKLPGVVYLVPPDRQLRLVPGFVTVVQWPW